MVMAVEVYVWAANGHWLGECPEFGIGTVDSTREQVEKHLRCEVRALSKDLWAERIDIINRMPPQEGE
jgi:hypothetical protein